MRKGTKGEAERRAKIEAEIVRLALELDYPRKQWAPIDEVHVAIETVARLAARRGFAIHGTRVVATWRERAAGTWLPVSSIIGGEAGGEFLRVEGGVLLHLYAEAGAWNVDRDGKRLATIPGLDSAKAFALASVGNPTVTRQARKGRKVAA